MKRRQRVVYFSSFCIVIVVGRAFTTARNHVFFEVTLRIFAFVYKRETVTKYLHTVLSLGTDEAFNINGAKLRS
ncbi:unnamed protein product [Acanthoscelides obtectus]|uniref:Uncharacterized protein n=1 Tax=Acanthoscelides obtectus TaxID=200917 RepID=A0A9P0LV55_ACAOB|nr:unnamed protein product [Acanthoscelides obtectus]CAH2000522.1 unnamed protein product [Acanthoscelides obtectus]CAK1621989.1 hypothetical protein AOBTE_LOCUS1257 [Acanthoscelides obtectus]CAK1633107.1 hypothetical protein AOBTE_LOCUS7954 [Acanthoscelides obtectus]